MKRVLSGLIAFLLIISLVPAIPLTADAYDSGYYTYTVSGGEATITDCSTSISGNITIPSTLGGYPVTSFGDRAFYGCSNLTSVIIPDSVTSIGKMAFYYCSSLNSVTIPDNVSTIGDYAFSNCDSLTSVTIGNSVTSIGSYVFQACVRLTSVTIPDSVTTIGDNAFHLCNSLTGFRVDEGNLNFSSDSQGILYNKDKTVLLSAPGLITMCTIPDSVSTIGDDAFNNCTSLESVTIPDGVTSIGGSAFYNCKSLTSITIPNSVTSIGDDAFYNCKSLTSITIPNSVTSIGDDAFSACDCLIYNTYGNGKYLGNTENPYVVLIGTTSTDIISITIHEDTKVIHSAAVKSCTSLESVTIPDGVTSIGGSAFYNCKSLTSVTIPDSVTSIGDSAFYNCRSLTSITIPNSVTSIGDSAFSNCASLTSITIPNSVTSIGDYMCIGCDSLTSVTIGNSITTIGDYAFYNCPRLAQVTIPSSVIEIRSVAFGSCSSMSHVWYSGSENDRDNINISALSNSSLNTATWHYNCCNPDSHAYNNVCDASCNNCDYVRTVPDHVYTNDCDISCNNCGGVRIITHSYDHKCDAVCNICGYERTDANHIYANDCDTTCNECGAIRNTTHIYTNSCDATCNICHYERDASHIYDGADDVTCNVCKETLAPAVPSVQSVTDTTVTLHAVDIYEYSMDAMMWQTSNVFTDLTPATTYSFYQRVAAGADNLSSPASKPLSVQTDKYVPDIPWDFTFVEITDTSVRLNEVADCEYSIDGRTWQTSPVFTDLTPGTHYTFYQRLAENGKHYASSNAALIITTLSRLGTITYNTNGGNEALQATTGQISTQIPSRSGYQFVGWALTPDTYAVYNPGDHYNQQEDIVLYAVWAEPCDVCDGELYYYGRCGSCLGSGTRTVTCISCGGAGSVTYTETCSASYCYDGWYVNGSDVRKCFTCKGTGTVTKSEDCSNCQGGIVYYDCIMCGGDRYEYRECEECVLGVQKITPDAPQTPKLQSISQNTVVLVYYSTCEYSVDGVNWQDSNIFSNLDVNKTYLFYQRYKAAAYTNYSNASSALSVTTLKESVLPPLPPVLQSKTFNKVILEKVDGCEYSLDGINWQTSNVFDSLLPSTSYTFYCRFAETTTHLYSAASNGLTVVTEQSALYNVVFVDWNGTVISSNTYRWGDEIAVPSNPTKAADNTYTYAFAGWGKEVTACAGDAVYTATYTPVYIDYTVTFENWDGSVLSEKVYHYGDPVTVPSDPKKPWDDTTYYVFIGWDLPVLGSCEGNRTYTATYESRQKLAALSPVDPIVEDYTSSKIVLLQREGYEYRLDDGQWTTDPTFTGLQPNTTYTVYQRIAQTETEYASRSSAGVTVKTGNSNPTSASNFERLWHYVNYHGGIVTFTEGNYTYQLDVNGQSVVFMIKSTNKPSDGVELSNEFALYPNENNFKTNCMATYYSGGKAMDMAQTFINVDRASYNAGTKLTTNQSGLFAITSSQLSNYATTSMLSLCVTMDAYLYKNLGFGLVGLGFNNFEGLGDAVCDIATGRHLGVSELRNQREAGCLIDGYTGDYYCSHCGEKTSSGRAIPCAGAHSYDGICDNTCNTCSEERRAGHTYTGDCDTTCDVCQSKRTDTAEHTFADGICTVCGEPDQIMGDLDGNEVVDEDDVIYLLQYLLMPEDFPVLQAVDYDHNGTVDEDDVIYLLQYLLMPDEFPLN